jgi:hypothetical protein
LDILRCIILVKKCFWKLCLFPPSGKGMKPTQLDPVNGSPRIESIPRTNLVDWLYQLLDVYRVNEVRHTEIHT